MTNIKQLWESFASYALPPEITPSEREKVQRIFYCGAKAMEMIFAIATAPTTNLEDSKRMMQESSDELNQFREQM